ncbi:Bifunctional purine biosynthetic protein ADE1 [Trichoderma lentiforme]|uniref:phosphoribosylamine--glycine ligase n=1 Tax=Trichoderma lentiforme TaxID=1567552 RepID=A0A9P4X469_9HYPO|nr:Bifunctional purine biosynthetic protein ADE1 [Trichoderma lentiforme]
MNDDIHKRRILLIGSGGREHALPWKLSQSASVEHVYVFPGNGDTVQTEKISNVVDESIAPTAPSLMVLRDIFVREAAELEGSKTYAKDFMRKYKIPTAGFQNFDLGVAADLELAKDYIKTVYHNVVIKASGLVAGKGVVLPSSDKEACEELDSFANGRFGDSGRSVVVEEYLEGDEISVLTFSDGKSFKSLPPGQDHKRIFNGNTGPNTGGMGVYAPTTFTILKPTFKGLRAEGRTFRGLLFTGIMITRSGPKVIEYNVRFGGPETQTMMPLLSQNTDLAAVLLACTQGTLKDAHLGVRSGYACNVVISSAGYPRPYSAGKPIRLDSIPSPNIHIFHAGTKLIGDVLQNDGGRVFSVAAYGDSLEDAVKRAYQGVKAINFEGMHFRTDIASRYAVC